VAAERHVVTPASGAPPAPRLTLSELNRQLLAALTRTPLEHSTVRLTRNAKGDTQIEVACRTGENECETIDEAAAKAREVYDGLRRDYPLQESAP
jgi:hypothetical protein